MEEGFSLSRALHRLLFCFGKHFFFLFTNQAIGLPTHEKMHVFVFHHLPVLSCGFAAQLQDLFL
jgi:hypothetical protein